MLDPLLPFTMVTICQKCGDRGFSEALIFCEECQIYAVHRYCLDVLPATFEEYVIWLCGDCESKIAKLSFVDKLSPFQVGENECEGLESVKVKKRNPIKKKKKFKKKSKRKSNTSSLTKSRVLRHGKSSSFQHREVRCSENCEKDREFVRQNGLNGCNLDEVVESLESKNSHLDLGDLKPVEMNCSEGGEKDEKHGRRDILDDGNFLGKADCLKTKKTLAIVPLEANCSEDGEVDQKLGRWNVPGNDFFHEEAERLNGLNKSSFHEDDESTKIKNMQQARFDIHPLEMDCSMDGEKDQNLVRRKNLDEGNSCGEADPETRQLVICDFPDIVEQSSVVCARPIQDHIWRGSLSIQDRNFGTVVGLVAHVSNLACLDVNKEAKSLPTLLSPELLPRSTIWPKSFANEGPSDENIALFFFPDSERNEKVFDSLVDEMMSQDLAMRAILRNAELLIFTSRMLPIDFWRFQSKFFLWGVFKGKQPLLVAAGDAVPGEEKGLTKALTWHRQSPVSPLSNARL